MAHSSSLLLLLLATLFASLLNAPGTYAAENFQVLWQFRRSNGETLFGEALELQLGEIRLTTNDSVTFLWGPNHGEATLHGIYQAADRTAFENCDPVGGRRVERQSIMGDRTLAMAELGEGTHYFFDDAGSNCQLKVKIILNVFLPENFVTAAPTPPPGVRPPRPAPETGITVQWTYLQSGSYAPISMWQDDYLRFQWSGESHTVRQVTKEAYDACDVSNGVIQEWQSITSEGDVNVTGLNVGTNYFLCYVVTHCEEGRMKLEVNVAPGLTRYFFTAWTKSGQTDEPVNITVIGIDNEERVWSAPATQLNQQASADLQVSQTVALDASQPGFFEVYAQDVGSPTTIRLTSSPDWVASYVRVQLADRNWQSKIFACTPMLTGRRGEYTGEQFCMEPVVPVENTTFSTRNDTPSAQECTCFREIIVKGHRVLVCTSDGCFATDDHGRSGWSDMHEIAHLVGFGTDGALYGRTAENTTLRSSDLGITWGPAGIQEITIQERALDYSFDVNQLTLEPLDEHVFPGNVHWGVSSQGVHFNSNGKWTLHGFWACRCEGSCGIKCNQ